MRLKLFAAVLLAAAAGAGAAHAAGLSGVAKAIFGNSTFNFSKPNLSKPPITSIRAGGLKVTLQHTRLSDIRKTFGGTIQSGGENGATWLCYTGGGTTSWFISNDLGGREFVMMIAVEPANSRAGCDAAPAKFSPPDFGIPTLGASVSDLKAKFGTAFVSGGKVSYRADEPARDALGTALNAQYIGYLVSRNVVSAVGVGETSAPN